MPIIICSPLPTGGNPLFLIVLCFQIVYVCFPIQALVIVNGLHILFRLWGHFKRHCIYICSEKNYHWSEWYVHDFWHWQPLQLVGYCNHQTISSFKSIILQKIQYFFSSENWLLKPTDWCCGVGKIVALYPTLWFETKCITTFDL